MHFLKRPKNAKFDVPTRLKEAGKKRFGKRKHEDPHHS
jgi:hypothetical protein